MKILFTSIILLISSNLWAAPIQVKNAYVRLMPPTQTITGAFMLFKNTGDVDRAVISGQSTVSEKVELHTHLHENGVMKMRQVDKIVLPAGGEVILKPGGYHVMLIGLKQALNAGQMVPITFRFDDGSRIEVEAEVKSVMGGMKMPSS